MSFVTHQFHCTSCSKYFDINLNVALNGSYRIHCPLCNHIHYRNVMDGKITEVRFTRDSTSPLIEDIYPMKSSCRDHNTDKDGDLALTDESFLHRRWKEKLFKDLAY